MSTVKRIITIVAVLLLVPSGPSLAAVSEYELKAALLFKVARFVEWPASAFTNGQATLNFCVLGTNRFGTAVEAWRGKKIHGRPVALRTIDSYDEAAAQCHVLFVSDSERGEMQEILAQSKGKPVLTVADMKGFAAAGGVMTFVTVDKHIRFEINPATSEAAGLLVSAQLMQLATIVEPKEELP